MTDPNSPAAVGRLLSDCRTIIFDFDGVLADSEKYHYLAYSEVFSRYGHTIDETEYYRYWTSLGQGARGEIERHGLDLDPARIKEEKNPIFSRYCRDGSIRMFDEAKDIVVRAAAAGKHMTIASGSTREDIEAILENNGALRFFDTIIGSDTVPAIKPAPDIFLAMLRETGRKPGECLVIEDAEKGMFAARTARIPVVVVRTRETRTFDFSAADAVVESHADLARIARDAFAD